MRRSLNFDSKRNPAPLLLTLAGLLLAVTVSSPAFATPSMAGKTRSGTISVNHGHGYSAYWEVVAQANNVCQRMHRKPAKVLTYAQKRPGTIYYEYACM